jgi:hypothetical protein
MLGVARLLLFAGLALGGCGSSSSKPPDAGPLRSGCRSCTSPDQCEGLECVSGLCLRPCETGADCSEPDRSVIVECTDADGAFYCVGDPGSC